MTKEELISKIVAMELKQFEQTKNIGGTAPCQTQQGNFVASRTCQWYLYDEPILTAYFNDLQRFEQAERNIVTEKYAYMMKQTDPAYFREISHMLWGISEEKQVLIEEAVGIMLEWSEEASNSASENIFGSRTLYSKYDTKTNTSAETYLRGEYATYSEDTLILLVGFYRQAKRTNDNLVSRLSKLFDSLNPPK